jgi:hypothetical protein
MSSEQRRRKRARKPHNAHVPNYQTLAEIIESVGSEPRKLPLPDGELTTSRKERCYRLMIERALRGKNRDLAQLLRLMAKYPDLGVERFEIQLFIPKCMLNV